MADPTSFSYQILDDQGVSNRTQVYAAYDGATETVDALIGAWSEYGGLVDACVDGQIVGGQILIPLEPNGAWKTAPAEGNNANQIMTLDFSNDFNQYLTPVILPSYKESQLDTNNLPNLAATALAALIARTINDTGTVFYNSRDLHQLDGLVKAFLGVRRLKNARLKTTVRP